MSQIFVSWGSNDQHMVKLLVDRIKRIGFEYFEYSDQMEPGEHILKRLKQEIKSSHIAILCLSDDTCKRNWVVSEITLLYEALDKNEIKKIIPVQVGTLDLNNLPAAMEGKYHYIPDISTREKFQNKSDEVIKAIYKSLFQSEPISVPTVLLAMNKKEFSDIGGDLQAESSILNVCGYIGMGDAPHIIDVLGSRYGGEESDFAPFCGDRPLIRIIQAVTDRLNQQRLKDQKNPVFIDWLNDDIFSKDQKKKTRARDLLRNGKSLIILDSLSTLHPRIKEQYQDLLFTNSAILWIPPFTQWTAELVSKSSEVIQTSQTLHDFFRDWQGETENANSNSWLVNYEFGLFTQPSLNHWLYRIMEQYTGLIPYQPLVNIMQQKFVNTMSTRHFS